MFTTKRMAPVVSIAALVALAGLAHGQTATPTQADFDRCNRVAQAAIGNANPSASPATSPSGGPSASGSIASSPAPSVSGSVTPPSGGTAAPSGGLSSSTSSSSDPLLRGMASAGLDDPAYQQAYRDCISGK